MLFSLYSQNQDGSKSGWNSADSLCEKAESTGALKFVAEVNACRHKAKEKKKLLSELNDKINNS